MAPRLTKPSVTWLIAVALMGLALVGCPGGGGDRPDTGNVAAEIEDGEVVDTADTLLEDTAQEDVEDAGPVADTAPLDDAGELQEQVEPETAPEASVEPEPEVMTEAEVSPDPEPEVGPEPGDVPSDVSDENGDGEGPDGDAEDPCGDCDDGDACTEDGCVAATGECVHLPVDCDDGDPCTIDVCKGSQSGVPGCYSGPIDCDDEDPCTTDACVVGFDGSGVCESTVADCDDANLCTEDGCLDITGECVNAAVVCEDGLPCTVDSCEPTEGCQFAPLAEPGCPCTVDADCADSENCTIDACGEDGCEYSPFPCNDSDPCTVDSCNPNAPGGGKCVFAEATCEDGNPCTIDTCNVLFGCDHTPKDCSDGDPSSPDCCLSDGSCTSWWPKNCSDDDPCTHDSIAGLVDGVCSAECVHEPKDCDDDNPCTEDACFELTGACVHLIACGPLGVCTPTDDGPVCSCPPDTVADGDGCSPIVPTGHATPSTCDDDGPAAWYDCDRDPANSACDPQGTWIGCLVSPDDPLGACQCIYGAEADYAGDTGAIGPTGCPIVRCGFSPCAEEETPTPPLCSGTGSPPEPEITTGWDWSLPEAVTPTPMAGFASSSLDPAYPAITLRTVDFSWAQLQPTPSVWPEGAIDQQSPGSAQGQSFASWDEQLADPASFWMRLWTSGDDWAPAWVAETCGVAPMGVDGAGQPHLPIWDPCVWGHLADFYRQVMIGADLRSDPRLRYVYVPGAFTWTEFDLNVLTDAVTSGALDAETFVSWFQAAMAELVSIMNGENDDPSDDYAWKLVFTGEDFPYGPFSSEADYLALDAVTAGVGIRNGIPENYNSHLNHVPAYGTTIAPDGRVVTDDAWPLFDGQRVIGMENECFTDCGLPDIPLDQVEAAVRLTNLKALQLRANWIYVHPTASYLDAFADHWSWVHLSVGKRAHDSPDAWVLLREARDRYWQWDPGHDWLTRPWVKNMGRWLEQRDICPHGISRRGSTEVTGDLFYDDGTSYEGRRTDKARQQWYLYFDVDPDWIQVQPVELQLLVTYIDSGDVTWRVEYAAEDSCHRRTGMAANTGTDSVRTARFTLPGAAFNGSLPGETDFRIRVFGEGDLDVLFVRLVREAAAQ